MQVLNERQPYLDWLRILSVSGVLLFHAAMPFVPEWEWHIKNEESSRLLLEFNFWLSRFRMPLLFFISGTVSYYMLLRKTGKAFVGLRFRRLLLPLLFAMLVIVPPQVYMERLSQGYQGSYLTFYPSIFTTGPYPEGNFSWHHLWFIAYLFVYDVICAPLFVWLMRGKGQQYLLVIARAAKGKRVYLFALPGIFLYAALYFRFPETNDLVHDWGRVFYWLCFLLAGFLFIAAPSLMESLRRNRRLSLGLALLSFVAITAIRWNDQEPWNVLPDWKGHPLTYAYIALWGCTAWCWLFAAVGYGKEYLNRKSRILNYINQAVYPFYILHQTVIVVIVFYVVKTKDSVLMKYLFTAGLSFFLSMAIYHLFIRPWLLMRFFFGMKK